MKKIFTTLTVLLLVVGCGTSSTSNQSKKTGAQAEFDWVNNDDFNPVDEIAYLRQDDVYNSNSQKEDVLSAETLSHASTSQVRMMLSSKDPISKSVSLCYQGKYKKAFKVISKNYSAYKNNPGYWNQVGTCYFLKKDLRKAVLFYHRAKLKDKNYVPAINNLGVVYLYQGKDQKALKSFQVALKGNLDAKTPSFNIAQLYMKFGKVKKAEEIVIGLRDIAPDDIDINSLLGTL